MKVSRDIVKPTVTLVIIALLVSAVVTIVYNITKVDEDGMSADAIAAASELLGTEELEPVTSNVFTENVKAAAKTANGQYAVNVTSKGYGGPIELLVGFDADGKIKGVKIIAASETPGIGSNVTEGDFVNQFVGLSGEIELGKNVDGVAGATISSKAVTAGVNEASQAYETIKAGGNAQAAGEGRNA